MSKLRCPKCKSTKSIGQNRTLTGPIKCNDCGFSIQAKEKDDCFIDYGEVAKAKPRVTLKQEYKIDGDGKLSVMRKGEWKTQYCPYSREGSNGLLECGDWCPKFKEHKLSGTSPAKDTLFTCGQFYSNQVDNDN
jgi:hypothetical protein